MRVVYAHLLRALDLLDVARVFASKFVKFFFRNRRAIFTQTPHFLRTPPALLRQRVDACAQLVVLASHLLGSRTRCVEFLLHVTDLLLVAGCLLFVAVLVFFKLTDVMRESRN